MVFYRRIFCEKNLNPISQQTARWVKRNRPSSSNRGKKRLSFICIDSSTGGLIRTSGPPPKWVHYLGGSLALTQEGICWSELAPRTPPPLKAYKEAWEPGRTPPGLGCQGTLEHHQAGRTCNVTRSVPQLCYYRWINIDMNFGSELKRDSGSPAPCKPPEGSHCGNSDS